jgi:transcriptional regulator GlxA family with amidase domain
LLLILFVALIVVAAVVFTILYIRRIKRHQQQTLEAYLKLVAEYSEEEQSPQEPSPVARQPESLDGDPFMQRVLTFVEQHLGDSNADIGQMAEACAVSRSVLQRRMKQLMGVSPGDFLREARIKHAAQLLQQSGAHVSDVAYRCGFSDPKYFSRCFKQSLGVSPSEFKAKF